MTINPFLILPLDKIDPAKDKRWMPDEDIWFLPCLFDVPNNTFSGYWYGPEHFVEEPHIHLGVASGIVFRGEMIFSHQDKKYSVKENQNFLFPPHLLNTVELIPGDNGFLFFGVFVGQANDANGKKMFDAKSYYEDVKKHYAANNITMI